MEQEYKERKLEQRIGLCAWIEVFSKEFLIKGRARVLKLSAFANQAFIQASNNQLMAGISISRNLLEDFCTVAVSSLTTLRNLQ